MSERDNYDQQFTDIMGAYEEQLRDPIVTAVLASVTEAEAALKQAHGKASSEMIDDVMFMLNSESKNAELIGNVVVISGKLRATELIGDDISDDDTEEERQNKLLTLMALADELDAIGGVQYDERGSYFEVSRRKIFCGEFELNSVRVNPEDPESEETEDKVIVYFAPTDEGDPSLGWAYAYPSDLTLFLPETPSALKINKEITELYPAIARQLDTLPKDCRDSEQIMLALQKLKLEINWADYPRLDIDDRKELIEFIEQYITNRVNFDTTLHLFSMHDYLMAMDVNGERAFVPLGENVMRSGLIGHVRILPLLSNEEGGSTASNITRYRMSIEVFSPVSQHGGGNNLLQVPLSSIDAIGNTRNPDLPAGQSFAEFSDPFSDLPPVPVEEAGWDGFSEPEDDEDDERDDTEPVTERPSAERQSVAEREQELTIVEQKIKELFSAISTITRTVYDSEKEADAALGEAKRLANALTDLYEESGLPLTEASGSGVISLRPQVDRENSQLEPNEKGVAIIRLTDALVKESDVLTERRGYFTSKIVLLAGHHDDLERKYAVEAIIEYADAQAMPEISFSADNLPITLFQYSPSAHFLVRIDDDNSALALVELERLRNCREAIAAISERFPDLQFLPWQLTELHELVDGANPHKLEALRDMDLIQAIGRSAGSDERAAEHTVDALKYIFDRHIVEVAGAMYDDNGVAVESGVVRGYVTDVTSSYFKIPKEEPMLVLSDKDQSVWFVPIASLRKLRY